MSMARMIVCHWCSPHADKVGMDNLITAAGPSGQCRTLEGCMSRIYDLISSFQSDYRALLVHGTDLLPSHLLHQTYHSDRSEGVEKSTSLRS